MELLCVSMVCVNNFFVLQHSHVLTAAALIIHFGIEAYTYIYIIIKTEKRHSMKNRYFISHAENVLINSNVIYICTNQPKHTPYIYIYMLPMYLCAHIYFQVDRLR